jgi:hypothetical protein
VIAFFSSSSNCRTEETQGKQPNWQNKGHVREIFWVVTLCGLAGTAFGRDILPTFFRVEVLNLFISYESINFSKITI